MGSQCCHGHHESHDFAVAVRVHHDDKRFPLSHHSVISLCLTKSKHYKEKKMLKKILIAIGVAFSSPAWAVDITGAGATFPYPVYAKWADAYKKESGHVVNYQSVGSGAGIKQIQSKTVTFGATDMPLKKAELDKHGLIQFPTVIGGNVPVINVDGIKPGEMVLDGTTLADIYLGKIKKWNDPQIAKLNPNLKLPDQNILVVRRSDGSGTTFIWTDYLSKVSTEWKDKIGAGTAIEWPVGIGAKGNEGVSGNVMQTKGSIGYVEFAYAKQNKMTHVALINKAGKAVQPSLESFQAAAAGAGFKAEEGFYAILTNADGDASWPVAGATFILMHKQPADAEKSKFALKFFEFAYANDTMAVDLEYVPLPDALVQQIKTSWSQVKL
jgi:phosphate transport system substrate-binding protein